MQDTNHFNDYLYYNYKNSGILLNISSKANIKKACSFLLQALK